MLNGLGRLMNGFASSLGVTGSLALLGAAMAQADLQPTDDAAMTRLRQRVNAAFALANSEVAAVRVQHNDGDVQLQLALNGRVQQMTLTPVAVRAPGYRLIAQVADSWYVDVPIGAERNYTGTIEGMPGAKVAASLTDQGMVAAILMEDRSRLWMEPVGTRLAGAPEYEQIAGREALHVVYKSSDALACEGTCGVTKQEQDAHRMVQAAGPPPSEGASGGLCVAQIAIDADVEYFTDHGSSVAQVEQDALAIINAVNLQYIAEAGITHQVSAIMVRTAEPDPYTSTNSTTLLDSIRSHWMANHGGITRDVVHLLTGKSIDGSVIGKAFLSSVCSSNSGYGFVQSDYSFLFGCRTDLSAHELGHNWSALHCDNDCDSTMNATASCANTFADSDPDSADAITTFRDSRSCLDCGPLLSPGITIYGIAGGDKLGTSVAIISDMNGDGVSDIVVGSPDNDDNGTNAGRVQLIDGANGAEIWYRVGAAAGDRFGQSVAAMEDRVIVGAPYHDTAGTDAGRVYVLDGANGIQLRTKNGSAAGDRFGWAVAGAPGGAGGGESSDINNDGTDDFIVGAPYHDTPATDAGAVYVHNGDSYAQLTKLTGQAGGDRFGWSVAMLGLVNGDSNADFIVGAPFHDNSGGTNAGKAYVYSGLNFAKLGVKIGANPQDHFGKAVAGPGRLNNDTRADFVVAAPLCDALGRVNAGKVYAYSGLGFDILWKANGAAEGDQFGLALAGAGDVNGDGLGEVAVGAPYNDAALGNAGRVQVRSGLNGAVIHAFNGTAASDQFGLALAGHGGLNEVDRARLAVGASFSDAAGGNAGQVKLYDGMQGGLAATWSPPHSPCAGDLVGDNRMVDGADLAALLDAWSRCGALAAETAEGDGGCRLDTGDLLTLLASWGACKS